MTSIQLNSKKVGLFLLVIITPQNSGTILTHDNYGMLENPAKGATMGDIPFLLMTTPQGTHLFDDL